MPAVTLQSLIDAGVHFGHQARRWNPKMKPFIHGKRHNIHLIDLKQTMRGLLMASHFIRELAATGQQVLFVGTKRQIRQVVESEAKRCNMPAISERWIGGTLTNFNTVRERLGRLEELEASEADGSMERHKKKAQAMLRREMRKIQRNLEGVRMLHGMPGAMVVVDPRREDIAMQEAARMNVPVIAILDTDCDPDLADIVVPGNDDAQSSVQLLLSQLSEAILEGRAGVDEQTLAHAQRAAQDDPRARDVVGRRGGPGDRPQRGDRRGGGGGGDRGGRRGGGGGRDSGGRGGADPGGRLGRRSTGRFADRAGGHADNISVGGDGSERAAPAAEGQVPAEGQAPVEAQAPAPAPESAAPAPESAAPASAPAPESAAPEASAPAGEGEKKES